MGDGGFWGGFTLATFANFSAVVLAVIAVAFAARAWIAGFILRWIGDKNSTWPVAFDITFSNAKIRRAGTAFGEVDIHAEIDIRPRWGTWTARHHPRITSALLTLRVGGKTHDRSFVVQAMPSDNQVPSEINQPRNILLRHTEKEILASRLPKGGEAQFEFVVSYPPHHQRRCTTERLVVPKLPDGETDASSGGTRGWKIHRWGVRGLDLED